MQVVRGVGTNQGMKAANSSRHGYGARYRQKRYVNVQEQRLLFHKDCSLETLRKSRLCPT